MTPGDLKILKTIELLVMLSRSRSLVFNDSTEEEKSILLISRQVLSDSGLTVPELTNSLHELSRKGYIWHMVIFDEHLRSQIDEVIKSDDFQNIMAQIASIDTTEKQMEMKRSALKDLKSLAPANISLDSDDFMNEPLSIVETIETGLNQYSKMRPDEIGIVILMPFRSSEKLLQKMNTGISFDQIRDDGFWYNKAKCIFHIDGIEIDTSYNNKPNLEHFIISSFYEVPDLTEIDYEDMAGFDSKKGPEAYQHAMRRFIEKHPSLSKIFTAHKYHTEFHPDRY